MGLQNSGSTFVIAMTDFRDECSPETISQYNKSELETMYYTHHGRLPRKMSKDRLLVSQLLGTHTVLISEHASII